MKIVKITSANLQVFINLAHAYESEFSRITGKYPNNEGVFEPDTLPEDNHIGYLLYEENLPVGFCITDIKSKPHDIAEFYIVPIKRKNNLGYGLAEFVFKKYPGEWQVRQIEGADSAIAFWRRVISTVTNDCYTENVIEDPKWGKVTCQKFTI